MKLASLQLIAVLITIIIQVIILTCLFLCAKRMTAMERATIGVMKQPQQLSKFPTIYTLMMNGTYSVSSHAPHDPTCTLALYVDMLDNIKFRNDVKSRVVSHVILMQHTYSIKFFKQLGSYIYFELNDLCKLGAPIVKMPGCGTADIFDNNDHMLHALGYVVR